MPKPKSESPPELPIVAPTPAVRAEPSTKRTRSAQGSPTEFIGSTEKGGQVRPADDRYMTDAQLDARDAYLLETTGPQAQQLVAKRGGFRTIADQLSDAQVAELLGELGSPDADELGELAGVKRDQLFSSMEARIDTMPNDAYRELLEILQAAVDADKEAKA